MSVRVYFDYLEASEREFTSEAFSIDVSRGRPLEGDVFNPGGGTIRVRNYEANFNPSFLVETFALLMESGDNLLREIGDRILLESGNGTGAGTYGEIELGRKVTVRDGNVTVFTGYVEDFDYSYDVNKRSEATLTVRDGLATLGATSLRDWSPSQQLTGARISAILNRSEVGFPTGAANREIATGTQPLLAGTTTTNDDGSISYGDGTVRFGTNALQEIQRINQAEYGRCFVDASGKLVFQDRYDSFGQTPTVTFSDDKAAVDAGTAFPFSELQVRFGTELLHFAVSVKRDGSNFEQSAQNDALIAGYPNLGVRNRTVGPLPFNSEYHALGLAQFMLERFQQFSAVISGLTVPLGRLSTANRATVCGLDIGDVIEVQWTPYGSTGQVSQIVAIEAVGYSFRASGADTTDAFVSFQLSDASDPDYFVVGTDSVDGPQFVAP